MKNETGGRWDMHLRHIRPRSVEWYDALLEDNPRAPTRLTPEETMRLRTLLAMEEAELKAYGRRTPPRMPVTPARAPRSV